MCNTMSRKDDPVFNVKFVELVESHPCLWNSTLPAYSKKEETQKAWQAVANETKDSVRNCRERWRTIRSSFLRSLKMSRTTSGRGKRKYYLSKYMQFLIPYTKTRPKNSNSSSNSNTNSHSNNNNYNNNNNNNNNGSHAARKAEHAQPPMTCISNMPFPASSNDETKDSTSSHIAIGEDEIILSLQDDLHSELQQLKQQGEHHLQLLAIKTEPSSASTTDEPQHETSTSTNSMLKGMINAHANTNTNANANANANGNGHTGSSHINTNSNHVNNNANSNSNNSTTAMNGLASEQQAVRASSVVDLTEFAEWIKCKNEHQRHCLMPTSPDADQSFLNSLHPFLKEMSSKQNLRFRQKVVALIDAVLDNAD